MKEARLEDLLTDWRDKAKFGPDTEKAQYLDRLKTLTEEMVRLQHSDTGMIIQPYQREDGSYFYSIKVPGAYGRKNE